MIKIALVVEAAGGGVAVHVADLIRELTARGCDVHLICPSGERFDQSILNQDVISACKTITRLPFRREVGLKDVAAVVQLKAALRRIRPDVVHSHSSKAGAVARLCRGPWVHVYTPHAVVTLDPNLGRAKRAIYGLVESFLGRFLTNSVVAVSDEEAIHLRRTLRIPQANIAVIYNGITNYEIFNKNWAREHLGVKDDAFQVGFVGRLEPQKGIDRLVDIAKEVKAKLGSEVHFTIIGSGAPSCQSLLHDPELTNMTIAGRVNNARAYFKAFDLLLVPSRYEGMPYVYLEAIAAGVPVVAARVAACKALIEETGVGIVVEQSTAVTGLVEAIARLSTRPTLREEMSLRCATAASNFNAQRMVDAILVTYKNALGVAV